MKPAEAARVTAIIRAVAEAEVLPRFRNLGRDQIREKAPHQLVTEADIQAERVLSTVLTAEFGGAVVGEEGVHDNPGLMDALGRPGMVWVLDPVDGTANFAHGNPRFAVIVALVVDGETVAGWIHDPVPNRTVVALKGQGAFRDGNPVRVAAEVPLDRMSGSVKRTGAVASRVLHVARRGSAAHDYLDLATGRLHFAHFRRLMPWDHAAGVLIHEEAGGVAALLDGAPYTALPHPDRQLLMAPGRSSWDQLARLIG
ncbi:inositol monophosphatase [Magnetospirillum sp. UT-4]|uniref:inositol monophosphatase family protein n=1 Tax=Magnetospirillum sp. UT-4 TaxID=2681467 RepID=UPI001381549F|nr:inositol monophosphatase [Magnetospirillum sp. UT-4]CAA7617912.1 Inositol monophosphatase [Magnetospirillum sp. UT-4]